jgi:hypothetical protein
MLGVTFFPDLITKSFTISFLLLRLISGYLSSTAISPTFMGDYFLDLMGGDWLISL